MDPMETKVVDEFRTRFGADAEVVASAPGRVNLIGEHTDYNDGFVFPMAVDRRIWVAGGRAASGSLRFASLNGLESREVDSASLTRTGAWIDYPLGVLDQLRRRGHAVGDLQAVYYGTIPIGSGLSSSAAIEVATLYLLMGLFNLDIPLRERPLICHAAETEFVGVKCGIMDQFISALAEESHALFLDCRSTDYRQIPLSLGEHLVAITDSKKKRGLVDSEYNRRREECETGVRILRQAGETHVRALRDVDLALLERYRDRMPPQVYKRCRHVVAENQRVLESVEALERGDLETFGALLNASHDSLRDDYEVSCEELDLLVEVARSTPGVLGSRLTGAGFGGCTVTIVHRDALSELEGRTRSAFRERFGYEPELMTSLPSPGAEFTRL